MKYSEVWCQVITPDTARKMLYKYDQLHRITQSRSLTNYSEASGFAMRNVTSAYDEDYSYPKFK